MNVISFYKQQYEANNDNTAYECKRDKILQKARNAKILRIIGLCSFLSVFPLVFISIFAKFTQSIFFLFPFLAIGGFILMFISAFMTPREKLNGEFTSSFSNRLDFYNGQFKTYESDIEEFFTRCYSSSKAHMTDLNFAYSLLHCKNPLFKTKYFENSLRQLYKHLCPAEFKGESDSSCECKAFYMTLGYYLMQEMAARYLLKINRLDETDYQKEFDNENLDEKGDVLCFNGKKSFVDAANEIAWYKKNCLSNPSLENFKWELFYYLYCNDALSADFTEASQKFVDMLGTPAQSKVSAAKTNVSPKAEKKLSPPILLATEKAIEQGAQSQQSASVTEPTQPQATEPTSDLPPQNEPVLTMDAAKLQNYTASILRSRGISAQLVDSAVLTQDEALGFVVSKYGIGADAVKAFAQILSSAKKDKGTLLSTGEFTFSARMTAEKSNITLVDKTAIEDYLNKL